MTPSAADINHWYQDQVVLLTGGTGTLGGCLLYKLAVQLPTKKIFVLCRGSVHQAIAKLEDSMAEQTDAVLDTGKVQFLVGEMTKPKLGLPDSDLIRLQNEVTVVINGAGNVSLVQDLRASALENSVPHPRLLYLCEQFPFIRVFLHISSAYVNSFLAGGTVEEQIYNIYDDTTDSEQDLNSILSTGSSVSDASFSAPYSHAKYIAERLLLKAMPSFPLLIVRPSNIGPAIRDPFPLYGLSMVIPVHTYVKCFMTIGPHEAQGLEESLKPDTVLDEIPVDLVANTCLLHLALGTTGIVHAASKLHTPFTVGHITRTCLETLTQDTVDELRRSDPTDQHDFRESFKQVLCQFCRDWKFDCSRSRCLQQIEGPLTLNCAGQDLDRLLKLRVKRVAHRFQTTVASHRSLGSSR